MPFTSHIPLPYIMGYDLQPLVTLEEKKKYLKMALEKNWKLFFGHDPEIAFATVKKFGEGYIVDEKFKSFE
jgi:glyoxylase-like metal-dependent hydrolase (beta-lactamase superfamily II)